MIRFYTACMAACRRILWKERGGRTRRICRVWPGLDWPVGYDDLDPCVLLGAWGVTRPRSTIRFDFAGFLPLPWTAARCAPMACTRPSLQLAPYAFYRTLLLPETRSCRVSSALPVFGNMGQEPTESGVPSGRWSETNWLNPRTGNRGISMTSTTMTTSRSERGQRVGGRSAPIARRRSGKPSWKSSNAGIARRSWDHRLAGAASGIIVRCVSTRGMSIRRRATAKTNAAV